MKEFKKDDYIEIYNPGKHTYFPIRILNKIESGYDAIILPNSKQVKIYDYQLKTYGFKMVWISEKILTKLGFKKDGLIFTLKEIVLFNCVIGELKNIEDPYYLYEYESKFLGYTILNQKDLDRFRHDYKEIDFNANKHKIMNQYFFTNSINEVFNHLLKNIPEKYSYREFDKIILENS